MFYNQSNVTMGVCIHFNGKTFMFLGLHDSCLLSIPAGVPSLDISHQQLHACLAGSQTELQAPATHC